MVPWSMSVLRQGAKGVERITPVDAQNARLALARNRMALRGEFAHVQMRVTPETSDLAIRTAPKVAPPPSVSTMTLYRESGGRVYAEPASRLVSTSYGHRKVIQMAQVSGSERVLAIESPPKSRIFEVTAVGGGLATPVPILPESPRGWAVAELAPEVWESSREVLVRSERILPGKTFSVADGRVAAETGVQISQARSRVEVQIPSGGLREEDIPHVRIESSLGRPFQFDLGSLKGRVLTVSLSSRDWQRAAAIVLPRRKVETVRIRGLIHRPDRPTQVAALSR